MYFLVLPKSQIYLNMPQLQQSNFHRNLSHEHGQRALKLFRFIKRRYINDAKWSNHLYFNLSLKSDKDRSLNRKFALFVYFLVLYQQSNLLEYASTTTV